VLAQELSLIVEPEEQKANCMVRTKNFQEVEGEELCMVAEPVE
jgi:hypothetical protein